jgi:uncharacterized protein
MELIVIGLIIFASGLIQGLSGFGSALVSISLLPFFMELKTAVPFVAINAMIISAINYHSVRSHFKLKDFTSLLIGSIIGAPIGIMILKFVNPDITKTILGALIIAYSLYCLLKKHTVTVKLKPIWAYIAGITAGIFGGSCTVNGPPVIIYLTKKYEDKHKIKAILAGFFLAAGIVNIIMFAVNGLYTLPVCKYSAGFAVLTILGVFTGNHYYNKINHDIFKKFIYVFLFISGMFLFWGSI